MGSMKCNTIYADHYNLIADAQQHNFVSPNKK